MSEAARSWSDDQQFLRDLVSKLEAGAAESSRLLNELDKKLSASPPRAPERTEPVRGWFRGGAS
jgi:hypothetical protein